MRLVPLGDKVVIRRLKAKEMSEGGIVLPQNAREKINEGRVLSVGDGRLLSDGSRAKPAVAEGDRVLFGDYSGTEVFVNGEKLLIMEERQIVAVVRCG